MRDDRQELSTRAVCVKSCKLLPTRVYTLTYDDAIIIIHLFRRFALTAALKERRFANTFYQGSKFQIPLILVKLSYISSVLVVLVDFHVEDLQKYVITRYHLVLSHVQCHSYC